MRCFSNPGDHCLKQERQTSFATSEAWGDGRLSASLLGWEQNPPVGMGRRDPGRGRPRRELLGPSLSTMPEPQESLCYTVICLNL